MSEWREFSCSFSLFFLLGVLIGRTFFCFFYADFVKDKKEKKSKNAPVVNAPFRRITEEDFKLVDSRVADNTFQSKVRMITLHNSNSPQIGWT